MAFDAPPNTPTEKYTGVTFRGKEVILTKVNGKPPQGLVRMGMEKGIYPQEKIIEAATVFAATGDYKLTSELVKIPEQSLRKLAKTQDFKDIIYEIRDENSDKFSAKFTNLVNAAQDQLLDRVQHGDSKLTREGVVRVPMTGKDLAIVAAVNFDKLQLILGKPTARTEQVSVSSRLEALADQFLKIANKTKERPPEIVDVEVIREKEVETPPG